MWVGCLARAIGSLYARQLSMKPNVTGQRRDLAVDAPISVRGMSDTTIHLKGAQTRRISCFNFSRIAED
jgi:hypothetical protein